MFEKLVIKNFQKHRSLIIEFDPQITVLIGKTDQGKSSVLRALRWLCLNQAPRNFIKWDKSFASVELHLDGHIIKRKRSTSANSYTIDGALLSAVNRSVPEQVVRLLNLTEVNFQRQHDQHFWISLSPGQVSKELNQIVDLSLIDRSLSKINQKLRKTKTEHEVSEERLKSAREQKKELDWTKEANSELSKIESKSQILEEQKSQQSELSLLILQVQEVVSTKKTLEEQRTEAQEIASFADGLMSLTITAKKLQDMLSEIIYARSLSDLTIPNISNLDSLKKNRISLSELIIEYDVVTKEIKTLELDLAKQSKIIQEVKVCPVCQNPLK